MLRRVAGRDARIMLGRSARHNVGMTRNDEVVALAPSQAVTQEEDAQAVKQPTHSTRGTAPGPRGCWAVNRLGDPCGAARRADGDYCNAHSGYGVAADPAKYQPLAAAASARNRRRRAILRAELGITRPHSLRGVLKATAFVERELVAQRVVGAVLDPAVPPAQAARLGLDLINAVDPPSSVTVTTPLPSTPEGVGELSLTQLMELGGSMGLLPLPNGSTEPMGEGTEAIIEG